MDILNSNAHLSHSQRELQPHGTAQFPCAGYIYHCLASHDRHIPWHWHEELEIIYIEKGDIELRIFGESHSLTNGDLVIINGNVLHSLIGAPEGTLQSFVFSPLLLTGDSRSSFGEKYITPLISNPHFICSIQSQNNSYNSAFTKAFEAISKQTFAYEFIIREELSRILLGIYPAFKSPLYTKSASLTTDYQRMELMISFIHTHFGENITLSSISQIGQIGERECLRCFKRTIGESPIQYLLKYRLAQSAHMLLNRPELNLAEIAAFCGFDSPSYYSKQFHRYYKCSPRNYRKHNGNKEPDNGKIFH